MTRRKLIAGNWKMNKTASEGSALIKEIKEQFAECTGNCCAKGPEVLVFPPFTTLSAVLNEASGSCLKVGAQNVHWANKGAYTGEISAAMLKELGVGYVLIGHSERRQYFAETDETVNQRVKAALAADLSVVICVGETETERNKEVTSAILERQVRWGLSGITAAQMEKVVIAYEPVWAIGTGKTASDADAQAVHKFIRTLLMNLFPCPCVAEATRILYGGSMNAANAAGLLAQPDIDGGLIGGASLKPADFAAIIRAAQ
ncbi:MAG: triose-phosphate isomerase [Lentisphaeria bacterium]